MANKKKYTKEQLKIWREAFGPEVAKELENKKIQKKQPLSKKPTKKLPKKLTKKLPKKLLKRPIPIEESFKKGFKQAKRPIKKPADDSGEHVRFQGCQYSGQSVATGFY